MLAELAIGHPWPTRPVRFKGERVYQSRATRAELYIKCAAILKGHSKFKRLLLDPQSTQRRIF